MTDRIRELAIQYRMIVDKPNGFDRTRLTPNERRFAESIIQECIAILDQDDGATHHEELLTTHFGITKPSIIYAGQEITTNNWVTHIDPTDPKYHNIKEIKYQPKTIQEIEEEYNLSITIV